MSNFRKFKILIKSILGKPISIRELTYSYIKDDYNIIDAGAHVGFDSVELSKHTRGIVHAFEPVNSIYTQLIQNTKAYNNIATYKLAISNVSEDTIINVSTGASDASSSLLKPKEHINTNPDVVFLTQETVKSTTFDKWMEEYNIAKIDFLWLDLQGMEYEVLKASPNLLSMVKVIYTEVSTIELYEGQAMYLTLRDWLIENGFVLRKEDLSAGFSGDALFVKK